METPQADAIKINCDAAFRTHSQSAAIAAIVRDSSGFILSLSSKIVPATSPLLAEAFAVREAVLLASGTLWPSIFVESDNQVVIEALRGGNQHWVRSSPSNCSAEATTARSVPPNSSAKATRAGDFPSEAIAESN
ncbi:Ribonuclease H-like superfamily [Sesbania bispinosa]|nr:Ribonuclease H-like superfamily [Sesbania bispinosa]